MDSEKGRHLPDSNIVIDFIKKNTNVRNVTRLQEDLKKSFVLGKRKSRKRGNNKKTKKSRHMTRNEKIALGLFHFPTKGMKYESVVPMNGLWKEYMRQQLELDERPVPEIHEKSWDSFSLSIYKADFHGASITVKEAKCSSLIGRNGICIMETKNTFKIISKDNIVRTIPKEGSVFIFHLDDFDFMFYGKHIARKPAERSVKVSKVFSLAEL
ncbi:ribonuclease P/MRP subunit POP4 [Arctopsyche grandis]|uniref:ribonuclease P/MRP subunit POP4 n=1 Tax=Arctopsyche grandis TaxID=121162 RepID=UPI00406D7776